MAEFERTDRDMPFSSSRLAVEELRNVAAARFSSLAIALLALGIGFLVPFLGYGDSANIISANNQFLEAGVNVLVASRPGHLPLDAERCERLNDLSGVIAAAGIDEPDTIYLVNRPGQPVSLIQGTRHAAEIIWPNDVLNSLDGASVVAGASIGREYGVRAGSLAGIVLSSTGSGATETIHVDRVAPPTIRSANADTTVLSVGPLESTAQCEIEVSTDVADYMAGVVAGWWYPTDGVIVSPLFLDASRTYAPLSAQLASRVSRWSPAVGFFTLLLAAAAYARSRRWDFATYRRLGLTRRGSAVFALVSTGVLFVLPASIGLDIWLAFFASVEGPGAAIQLATLDAAMLIAAIPLIAPLAAVIIARTTPADVFAER